MKMIHNYDIYGNTESAIIYLVEDYAILMARIEELATNSESLGEDRPEDVEHSETQKDKNRGHCKYFPCKQQKGTGKR